MSKIRIFHCAMVVWVIGVGALSGFAQGETPESMTLEQVTARITKLEGDLVSVITTQAREKHKAEFGDKEAIPQRVESKKLEKQLLELRTAYYERLRVKDEGIRTLEADIDRRYKEIKDFRQLTDAIDREISFAESSTNQAVAAQLTGLAAEAEQGRAQLVQAQVTLDQLNKELAEKRAAATAKDKQAGRMAEEIKELADQHQQALAELNKTVDVKVEVGQFDERRQAIMLELDVLRHQRNKLANQETTSE